MDKNRKKLDKIMVVLVGLFVLILLFSNGGAASTPLGHHSTTFHYTTTPLTTPQDTCPSCDCNIVQIYDNNTQYLPRIDADQDLYFQDGSGAGWDPDDRDPCNPGTMVGSCDQDNDGLTNDNDNCDDIYNPTQDNGDGDTIGDACDNCPDDTNENQQNSDGDTHGDACDICPNDTDEGQENSDGDTYGDACDNCPSDTNEAQTDTDSDDVGDVCDNCLNVINTLQINSDTDTLGDACDNCDLVDNNDQVNDDGDSHGNACDNCPDDTNEGQEDGDGDTVGDACDVCPSVWDSLQLDYDSDGLGDVCDSDADNDGWLNTVDCDSLNENVEGYLNNLDTAHFTSRTYKEINSGDLRRGIYFKPDGTKMFVAFYGIDSIRSYNLSTAWDISTATSAYPSYYTGADNATGLYFKPDGTAFYISNGYGAPTYDYVERHNLSTAWDISTASYSSTYDLNISLHSISFKPDGTAMYLGDDDRNVRRYNLSTAWDITTSSYSTLYEVTKIDNTFDEVVSLAFSDNGKVVWVTGYNPYNKLFQYRLSTAWDISTMTFDSEYGPIINQYDPQGIYYSGDSYKLFAIDNYSYRVYELTFDSCP